MRPHEVLEVRWAEANGLDPRGMVACSSGTSALHLAFEALRLPAGSEVICPDYTMVACPRAVVMAGLKPVFVDCDDRLLMSSTPMLYGITSAALVVHVHGRKISDAVFESRHSMLAGAAFVEDLAEAHGVFPHRNTDAACWSFYRNKIVAGEEGGAVWFRDPEHAALARQLRCVGFTPDHDYTHIPRGHNYRLADSLAWVIINGDDGVSHFRRNVEKRQTVCDWYDGAVPGEWRLPRRDAAWVYDLRIRGLTRAGMREVVRGLQAGGVAARYGFVPMTAQQEFYDPTGPARNPTAYRAAEEVFSLPVRPEMTKAEVTSACESLVKLAARLKV